MPSPSSKAILDLSQNAVQIAPALLGGTLSSHSEEGTVSIRLTEVEAYLGAKDSAHPDPGSHSFNGLGARNAVMFGPAGHLYVYFTYGMYYCMNIVCGPEGESSAVLMRAGEVIAGSELARQRRFEYRAMLKAKSGAAPPNSSISDRDLARGPSRLTQCLGVNAEHNGMALGTQITFTPALQQPKNISTGPRVGVSGEGGTPAYPWRFWLDGERTVSPYKAALSAAARKRSNEKQ